MCAGGLYLGFLTPSASHGLPKCEGNLGCTCSFGPRQGVRWAELLRETQTGPTVLYEGSQAQISVTEDKREEVEMAVDELFAALGL